MERVAGARNAAEPDKNGREAVEAVFVLTAEEKYEFPKAIERLPSERATQRMYQAVVTPNECPDG